MTAEPRHQKNERRESGGTIEIDCITNEGVVRISVSDTGLGIAKDHHEMIFAPFAQIGRTLASPKEGTGLGLSISRDHARETRGELSVKSVPGKGSIFTLEPPRAH